MKILLLFISVSFFISSVTNAQLGNNNMTLLSNMNIHPSVSGTYSAIWGYKDEKNGREYAILGCYTGTSFVDITDPDNIYEVSYLSGPSSNWREMKTYSNYAYIVSEAGNSGIQIVDLQYLPDSIHFVKKFVPSGHVTTHSISQEGPYLYLNGANASFGQGVTVLDLTTDPETPIKRGGFNTDYIHDCRVKNDTIYAANILVSKVSIISAVNKNSLSLISSFINLPNSGPHNTALTSDNKYILVTDEIGSSPRKLKIWNKEDLGDITYVSSWQPTGITSSIVHNVEVYGNFALVAHYRAGIRMVDITNKSVPSEVAWYDTYPSSNGSGYNGCWGVYMFPTGKIIASDMQTGLYVLKVPFNIKMSIEAFYNSVTNSMITSDTVRAYLQSSISPYNKVDSAVAYVSNTSFTGKFHFYNAPAGNYYLVMNHRNSIETWSGSPIAFDPMGINNYDYTDLQSKAYGNNMIQVDNSPVRYAVFSGDANKDNSIDLADLGLIDNDAGNFVSGYVSTDINGDGLVDLGDISTTENNSFNFVTIINP